MAKADLQSALANAGGGTRRKPQPGSAAGTETPRGKGREGTRPITVHFPVEVRNQIKIMAAENNTTMHRMIAEALNDLFAKYGKPEIAPLDGGKE